MQTGITVPDNVREEFNNMRMKRSHRFVIYKASDDKASVEVETLGPRDATWEQFQEAMPKNRSR